MHITETYYRLKIVALGCGLCIVLYTVKRNWFLSFNYTYFESWSKCINGNDILESTITLIAVNAMFDFHYSSLYRESGNSVPIF